VHVCANNLRVTVLRVAMCFKYRSQRLLPGEFTWRAVCYWRFLRETASRGPLALAHVLVTTGGHCGYDQSCIRSAIAQPALLW